jgi:hypothetical protein
MIEKTFIDYFKMAHGFFNFCMLCLFCYQGWLGLKIRKGRLDGMQLPLEFVRRHRSLGPVFALWGVLGFCAGLVLVLLDKGRIAEYPLHLAGGAGVAAVIVGLYAVSRRIIEGVEVYRDVHFGLGMLLLCLYVVQSFLGLAVLL